ncbi:PP2C family protein-serine/threonine phosphatase [Streptomyces hilarionis]|uniref:PP2C family protein-serine/threonine phosphatase n=1 Tax=Streptomyces hilarionis TaxID=2839954 RepID=UPI00211A5D13|nr:PP2C family protein-serine/threonine phosphatase [Streptomyces hilarionis]MCQ9133211.1 serine/threonine-protein phosphatase [Streptomyces hilarionis]
MNGLLAAARALRAAAPHRLPGTLHTVLRTGYAAEAADLLLADYGLTALLSVPPDGRGTPQPRSVPLHGSAPGRAFGAQEPFVEELDGGSVLVHLPVTVRGDRLGVLSVTLPGTQLDEVRLAELAELAQLLGHEVVVAERDTDVYRQARRTDRLTLAAEMQWQLLPARSCAADEYALGAQLEPAYDVFGDNFDWAASADRLTVCVTDGMGQGIEASLLTGLGVNALRNARRAALPVADQAALADQAIHAHYRGEAHLAVLLAEIELSTGRMRVVDAGSPHLLLVRDRTLTRIALDAQLPLGMFEETDYTAQEFRLLPGDRLLFVSDGVHAVASPDGELYGEHALARAVTSAALLPAADVPGAVLRELTGHRGRPEPDDDALVVCLDWFGRRPGSPSGDPGTDPSPGDGHSTVPSPSSGPQRHDADEE